MKTSKFKPEIGYTMFTYEIENINEYTRRITGEISVEKVKEEFDKTCRELSRMVMVPGFRKGKAPVSIVKRRFSSQIKNDVQNKLFQDVYPKIIEKENIHTIGTLINEKLDFVENKPMTFDITLEIVVMDDLKPYLNIPITIAEEKLTVSKKEIRQFLKSLQSRHGELKLIEDRPAKKGDFLTVDIYVTDGDEHIEMLDRESIQISIGKNSYISEPQFDKNLIGIKHDETKEFTIHIRKKQEIKTIAGKDITFKVTVHEIKEVALPELNDEFAELVGAESYEKLETSVREDLQAQKDVAAKQEATEQIVDKLVADNEIIVPTHIIQTYADDLLRQHSYQEKKDIKEAKQEAYDLAVKNIKKTFIIPKIAELEKITVDDEEISSTINQYNQIYNYDGKNKIDDTPDARKSIRRNLVETKTLDFLYSKAILNGKPIEQNENEVDSKQSDDDKNMDNEKKDENNSEVKEENITDTIEKDKSETNTDDKLETNDKD